MKSGIMSLKLLKLFSLSLVLISVFTMLSCEKNDDELKNQIANLESRISGIENELLTIDGSLALLQEQGKLNSDEVSSLKQVSIDLSGIAATIKNGNAINSAEIASLKASLAKTTTSIQFDGLKKTVAELTDLVDSYYLDQKLTEENTKDLQALIIKLSADLDSLKSIESTQEIVGKIEKGAFAKGSLITLYEMDSTLSQTGRSFNSTIEDNFGSFHLKVKNLKGKLARVVADGFYFNEVTNRNSTSKISLTGIVRIDSSESINVNVLTHLEEPRVKYLMGQGLSFDDAKVQAVTEVLNVFGITNSEINRAEKVSLIDTGSTNNVLLALSTMMVGYRSDSELIEILNDIAQDLKLDGTLDNIALGDDVFTHLYYLNPNDVLNHVRNKYNGIYSGSVLNGLNLGYMLNFKQSSSYSKSYNLIDYPEASSTVYEGKNVLGNSTNVNSSVFEATAVTKVDGLKLRVEISADFGGNPPPPSFVLTSLLGTNSNWIYKSVSSTKAILETTIKGLHTITLSVQSSTRSANLNIKFFENSSAVPTQTKTVAINY